MSTETPRRLALVLSDHSAARGSPPGVEPASFAAACLADTYEVLADLVGVTVGIVGDGDEIDDLLWPGDRKIAGHRTLSALAVDLAEDFDEVVVVPADVPDLPGLVIAKVFKALQRADVCVAPERGPDGGCVVVGVRTTWPEWIPADLRLDLDRDPRDMLFSVAPRRSLVAVGPDWHRMRTTASIQRLDPRLEGWEMTRSLLSRRELVPE